MADADGAPAEPAEPAERNPLLARMLELSDAFADPDAAAAAAAAAYQRAQERAQALGVAFADTSAAAAAAAAAYQARAGAAAKEIAQAYPRLGNAIEEGLAP